MEDFYPTELSTHDESVEHHQAMRGVATFLGTQRTVGGEYYWLQSNTIMTFKDFYPLEPRTATNLCLEEEAVGGWKSTPCNVNHYGYSCERNSWPTSATRTVSVSPIAIPSVTTPRYIAFDGSNYLTPNPIDSAQVSHLGSITKYSSVVFGMTVHLGIQFCDSADWMTVSGLAGYLSYDYNSRYCRYQAWYSNGLPISEYMTYLVNFRFYSTNFLRTALTFSWMLWDDNRMNIMYMDQETRHVYVFYNLGFLTTWEDIYTRCRNYGRQAHEQTGRQLHWSRGAGKWRMVDINSHREFTFVRAQVDSIFGGYHVPILAVHNTSGAFSHWVNGSTFEPFDEYHNWIDLYHNIGADIDENPLMEPAALYEII